MITPMLTPKSARSLAVTATQEWHDAAIAGDWYHPVSGPFTFTRDTFESWIRNARLVGGRTSIDYDHVRASGERLPPEVSRAAGFIESAEDMRIVRKLVTVPGPGDEPIREERDVFQVRARWTDRATEFIRSGEFWGVSVVAFDDWPHPSTGESIGPYLFNLALTDEPFMTGLEPVAASMLGAKGEEMDEKKLRALLGVDAEADIEKTITDLKAKADAEPTVPDDVAPVVAAMREHALDADAVVALMTKPSGDDDPRVVKLTSRLAKVEADLAAEREDARKERETRHENSKKLAVSALVEAGRVDPSRRDVAEKAFDAGEEFFEQFCSVLPPAKRLRVSAPSDNRDVDGLVGELAPLCKKALNAGARSLAEALDTATKADVGLRQRWLNDRRTGKFDMNALSAEVDAL